MELTKYIDRKYPKSKNKIKKLFDEEHLKEIKNKKYRVAILTRDISDHESKHKKGTLFIFKRYKEYDENIWTGEFQIHAVFKCEKGFTESGYYSTILYNSELKELSS